MPIDDPFIGTIRHQIEDGFLVVVATNHTATARDLKLRLKNSLVVKGLWAAAVVDGLIPQGPFRSAILLLKRAAGANRRSGPRADRL